MIRNNLRSIQIRHGFIEQLVKIHTGRTHNLRYNYSLGSINDKCSAFRHQRKVTHKYFLLFYFICFAITKTNLYFQGGSISSISGFAFFDIIFGILRIH